MLCALPTPASPTGPPHLQAYMHGPAGAEGGTVGMISGATYGDVGGSLYARPGAAGSGAAGGRRGGWNWLERLFVFDPYALEQMRSELASGRTWR